TGRVPGLSVMVDAQGNAIPQAAQAAFPLMVKDLLPAGLRGIVVAGLLAALMSSMAGAFNASSTLFTMDLYTKFRPNASQHQLVWVDRAATARAARGSDVRDCHSRGSRQLSCQLERSRGRRLRCRACPDSHSLSLLPRLRNADDAEMRDQSPRLGDRRGLACRATQNRKVRFQMALPSRRRAWRPGRRL